MITTYHVLITQEEITEPEKLSEGAPKGGVTYKKELLSIRVDEDPTKQIMRLLSAEAPKSRTDKGGTHKKPATEGVK